MDTRRGLTPLLAAMAFLAAHLWTLPAHVPTAMATDVATRIGVFPVGASDDLVASPVFLLLGKAGMALALRAGEGVAAHANAYGLASWGAIFGGIAAWPLLYLFGRLSERRDVAWAATLLTLTAPVVWAGAWLPTSHVPGFMLALVAQALLVGALLEAARYDTASGADVLIVHRRDDPVFARLVSSGALVSSIALGLRPVTLWLTLPLLVAALAICWRRRARALVGAVVILSAVAFAAWAVPLMVAVGGPSRYWSAVVRELLPGAEAGSLLSGEGASIGAALWETFVRAWGAPWLGLVVVAVAAGGLLAGPRPAPRGRRALTLAVVPYAVLHLLLHDPRQTILALPLVPVVAYFASLGLQAFGRRVLQAGTLALVLASLVVAWRG